MINKDGKLFGKISIIDILVVIIIIAVAAGVYMRFFSVPETVNVKTDKFTYMVRIEKVRNYSVDALYKKGAMYDSETKEYLGDISEVVSVEPTKATGVTSRGETVEVEYPERYTVTIKVETDGNIGKSGYYTESNRMISVGGAMNFETKYIDTSGDVISISEK